MTIQLDHIILAVNDQAASVGFFVGILGFADEGHDGPFAVVRVSPDFTLQLAPWGTKGGEHLAFAMSKGEFDAAFRRLVAAGLPYGDGFDKVGNMRGPGMRAARVESARPSISSIPTSISSKSGIMESELLC